MDWDAARMLLDVNNKFYARNAASFSSSRHAPWPGWGKVLDLVDAFSLSSNPAFDVLDLAAGNGRFEWFLAGQSARRAWRDKGMRKMSCWTLDGCGALLSESAWKKPFRASVEQAVPMEVFPRHWDLCDCMPKAAANKEGVAREGAECLQAYEQGGGNAMTFADAHACLDDSLAQVGSFDLVVCFGFFHHVPGVELRHALLRALLDRARPGGLVAISLWRFLDVVDSISCADIVDEAPVSQDEELTDAEVWALLSHDGGARLNSWLSAKLEENDRLLGWRNAPSEVRYCHAFTAEEADALIEAASSQGALVSRFKADGRESRMNEYLVFRRI